ncbi:MAG: M23 family metallopeptidase [Candidatus Rokubacteria bacterium]|nr:M23 family metallopeptidase [Candidatus Rokubacteria bacterium]
MVVVQGIPDGATLEGSVAGRSLVFFPYAGGAAALAGIDFETRPGRYWWKIAVVNGADPPLVLRGRVTVKGRQFAVERLTLPEGMVELDEETTRRADAEDAHLKTLYATVTGDRLWRGRFTAPVASPKPPSGFGARRVINGRPRSPHGGLDYAADRGTPVVAANAGRVVLVGDFFFPGRLVVVDHGLGVHTAYFHLDRVTVAEQDLVDQGQPIGEVGSTGRATGPHLHFSASIGSARIDPAALLRLNSRD